jgi:hypothetical protein
LKLENWPPALKRLSMPGISVCLSQDQAKALGSNILEYGPSFGPKQDISELEAELDYIVKTFPNGVFVRLGSRSPKDSLIALDQNFCAKSGAEALSFLLDCSERIADDLHLALANGYSPHIWLREYVKIPKWSEFRCFMQDRKLMGISQYYYHDSFPEIQENADSIQWAIERFFDEYFRKACHLDNVVFDVFVIATFSSAGIVWEVKLNEINPYFQLTDPCLFEWKWEKNSKRTEIFIDSFFKYKRR